VVAVTVTSTDPAGWRCQSVGTETPLSVPRLISGCCSVTASSTDGLKPSVGAAMPPTTSMGSPRSRNTTGSRSFNVSSTRSASASAAVSTSATRLSPPTRIDATSAP